MNKNAKYADTNQLTSIQKKHQVNLRWNHTRNFQLGLILSLLFVIIVVESVRVEIDRFELPHTAEPDETVFVMNTFVIEESIAKPEPKVKTEKVVRRITTEIKVVPDISSTSATALLTTEPPKITVDPGTSVSTAIPAKEEPAKPVMMNLVTQIPRFPGCSASNSRKEQLECFTKMTHRFIQRKFDYDLGARENLQGKVRIYCQFTIGPDGKVVDIKAQTRNEALKREAIEVLSKLPQMTPGKQVGQEVPVVFQIPVVFQVQD